MQNAITVEHLAYSYPNADDAPRVPVFEDLNLNIEQGTFVAILGSNGCGKSTLAKHFNSILLPCGGAVYVCGINTADEDKLMTVRRNVGMVFQNPDNQIVANVVEEDVAFGPENLGVASPMIRKRVDQALKQVGMNTVGMRPIFCPVDRSSGWRLPVSLPWSRNALYWMSLRLCWIRRVAVR